MKKFIIALVAASVLSSPVLAAPNDRHDNRGQMTKKVVVHKNNNHKVVKKTTVQYRNWRKGDRFDARSARNYRVVDARRYKLREAPRGYRWVQSGNDAVLIGITSGIVSAVLANAIR